MKSLVWGDLHSHNFREFSENINGINSRLLDCANVITELSKFAEKEKIEKIYFLGDLFQLKNNLSSDVIKVTMDALNDLVEDREMVIIPGNHDYTLWSSNPTLLNLFSKYIVKGKITIITEPTWIDNCYFEPYTRQTKELNERIKKLEVMDDTIFFGHQDIIGMQYGGFEVEHGLDPEILVKQFRRSFVGHCHEPMKVVEDVANNRMVISVGAPLQHSFSDVGGTRGWWTYDSKDNNLKFITNTFSPKFMDYEYDEKDDAIPGDPEKDFYRIKVVGNVELPPRLQRIKWKRINYIIGGETKKRTSISFSDKSVDVIQKYTSVRGGGLDHKRLIKIGQGYLQ